MIELLCPAGSMEALIAAVSNGADAIYLGMNKFGARAYASNFDEEGLVEAVRYCHLRGVKVYVTMNTIVFDRELEDAYKQIDFIYKVGVDGVIIQDLAIFNYVVRNYPLMEAHTSTQMGIDDIEGSMLLKELGAKRIVLSRELPIDEINKIKKAVQLPLEIFAHGALCVSYSGGCLMSGLVGYRSGNRGRCVGSCRKKYKLYKDEKLIGDSYLLSMKDLCTVDYIKYFKEVDSLKIEGRMKEEEYVANIASVYRKAIDNELTPELKKNLFKTFNRTYTKGYIFGEDKKNITNISRPNNFGYPIGKISKVLKYGYEIELTDILNQNDIIRIASGDTDTVLSASKIYDEKDLLVSSANKKCIIKIKEKLNVGDIVYKTKDINFYNELKKSYPNEYRKFAIDVTVYGGVNLPLTITATLDDIVVSIESDFICEEAKNAPLDETRFTQQFSKMNDSIYRLNSLSFYAPNIFLPVSKINELRRQLIQELDNVRYKEREEVSKVVPTYQPTQEEKIRHLAVSCYTLEQLKAAQELGVEIIYYKDHIIRRNKNTYKDLEGSLLVGGYGGIYRYKDTNEFVTDYSLNCVNSETVYQLHKLGAHRVCLSHEINYSDICLLIDEYQKKTNSKPNLEMIVYGNAPMMHTNYCPLKVYNQCGECRKHTYYMEEEYGKFPIINHSDCTTTILNGKTLNLIDELDKLKDINTLRLSFTTEDYEQTKLVIQAFIDKMNGKSTDFKFNGEYHTRGHFNKDIM